MKNLKESFMSSRALLSMLLRHIVAAVCVAPFAIYFERDRPKQLNWRVWFWIFGNAGLGYQNRYKQIIYLLLLAAATQLCSSTTTVNAISSSQSERTSMASSPQPEIMLHSTMRFPQPHRPRRSLYPIFVVIVAFVLAFILVAYTQCWERIRNRQPAAADQRPQGEAEQQPVPDPAAATPPA